MHLGKPKFRAAFWTLQAVLLVSYIATVVWASGMHDSTGFGVALFILFLTIFTLGIWLVLDAVILAIHAYVTRAAAAPRRTTAKG